MKKMNKKGFTIVELVIVIAVIAILASVLIPTFSGVVSKANQSAALQEATSTMKSTLAMSDYGTIAEGTYFVVDGMGSDGYQFTYENNKIAAVATAISSVTYSVPTGTAAATKDSKNAIIINTDLISGTSFTTAGATVEKIIKAALGVSSDATLTIASASGENYKYTITDSSSKAWHVYTNSDYATDVVTFTYSK